MSNTNLTKIMAKKIKRLENEMREVRRQMQYVYIIKTTAGVPATGASGMLVENTNDNTVHVYAFGAWRQIFP